ncbi:hypothetical protein P691DRAFT_791508 [Macrolepiota fuliginosa MF-IS2]|uniref:Uncharacterized protein n=1 Tax=Macrolepiota fuliginosa MF-IS2 TaxID=1400762 RepID=A0A9P6BXD4_9AGAR|nr:hypothetical protein P691DRAFT_791508 [Macrolepiota fuliginosa MF-IS2]
MCDRNIVTADDLPFGGEGRPEPVELEGRIVEIQPLLGYDYPSSWRYHPPIGSGPHKDYRSSIVGPAFWTQDWVAPSRPLVGRVEVRHQHDHSDKGYSVKLRCTLYQLERGKADSLGENPVPVDEEGPVVGLRRGTWTTIADHGTVSEFATNSK